MPEERTQCPPPDEPLPEVLVAVAVRAERHLRVVDVQAAQATEGDGPRDGADDGVRLVEGLVRHTGREEMLGVEADPEPSVPRGELEDAGELVETASDRAARSGCVLEQEHARLPSQAFCGGVERRDRVERERAGDRCEPGTEVAARVQHEAFRPEA